MTWYMGFYEMLEGDIEQPKYQYLYLDYGIVKILYFDTEFNLIQTYSVRGYMEKHHAVGSDLSFSSCKLELTENKRKLFNKGYGSKFGKPVMRYDSKHTFKKCNKVFYKNHYKFENGDESKAVYLRTSAGIPPHLSDKLKHHVTPRHPPA